MAKILIIEDNENNLYLETFILVGDRENILAAGWNDYIEKPINPDAFVHQLSEHL